MSEATHTKEFELGAPFAHDAVVIVNEPADTTDHSAAFNATATVFMVFAVIAIVLVLISANGGRK